MSKPKLNRDEKEILKDIEAGKFESVLTPRRKKYIQASAEETFKKDKRINIREALINPVFRHSREGGNP